MQETCVGGGAVNFASSEYERVDKTCAMTYVHFSDLETSLGIGRKQPIS